MTLLRAKPRAAMQRALPFIICLAVIVGIGARFGQGIGMNFNKLRLNSQETKKKTVRFSKEQISETLGSSMTSNQFPKEAEFEFEPKIKLRTKIRYSIDPKLQKDMEALFADYDPDYGAFVALDAKTGKVLAMVSHSKDKKLPYNMALRSTFPSASVFKVVTATAAIEGRKISPDTLIPFNGRKHTLYRGQILKTDITRWTKFITLKEAFAHSINTVFGKIGAFTVGYEGMRQYADRFGFDRRISADMPIQEGHARIPDDIWGLAESASGFTTENTMSPLQGALIASTVANNGVMMEPYIVESIYGVDDSLLYTAEPRVVSVAMESKTASEVRTLMKETVLRGTSKSSFRGFFKKRFSAVSVGGKTGSLTGYDPHGKYDWFVGFADYGPHQIAVAALTIHEKLWRVKSSYIARRAIESYFTESTHHKTVAEMKRLKYGR